LFISYKYTQYNLRTKIKGVGGFDNLSEGKEGGYLHFLTTANVSFNTKTLSTYFLFISIINIYFIKKGAGGF
jgi:hypothetical protein